MNNVKTKTNKPANENPKNLKPSLIGCSVPSPENMSMEKKKQPTKANKAKTQIKDIITVIRKILSNLTFSLSQDPQKDT